MSTGEDQVARVLELASRWQLDEALTRASETSSLEIQQRTDMAACRTLLKAHAAMRAGRYEKAIREALPALTHLEKRGYTLGLDWVYSAVGFSFGILGDPETGLEWVARALAGATRRGDNTQLRRSLNDQGCLLAMLDEQEQSILVLEKAVNLNDPPASPAEMAGLLNNLAYTGLHFARRLDQSSGARTELAHKSLQWANQALKVSESISNDRLIAWSLDNLGSALSLIGRVTGAQAAFVRALPLSEPYERIHVELLASYAWLLTEVGRHAEATEMLDAAYEKARTGKQEASIDRILETRIRLELLAGRTTQAQLWSERRFQELKKQYRQRLTSVARNAEIFVDLEKARQAEREALHVRAELTAINENLANQSIYWKVDAIRDALTGCFNRRGLDLMAEDFFAPGRRCALVRVDIDYFTQINENFGREAGDRVLQTLAHIMLAACRESDLVVRLSGDEFLLLLYGVEFETARATCERLRAAVEENDFSWLAAAWRVTISLGLAIRDEEDDLQTLLARAEAALQRAKKSGRNRVEIQSGGLAAPSTPAIPSIIDPQEDHPAAT